jgi:predicted ATPase/DNA-binding CsgD family transcriptional regulator
MARPARRPGNLPAEATSFIGRRRELADVRTKLTEARLVSLVGPGGVGKTRLAIRAATDLVRGLPGGAWLVELSDVRDPALVGHAFMAALDLRDQAVTDPVALLLAYLRDKRLLLVVDNCEHLLAAAAGFLAHVVRTAPGVRVIATSREPLSVPGEHVVAVPPLDLPSDQPAVVLERLRRNEAVRLFVERAAAGPGGFELTDANHVAVVEVCRRLDGLPLAIELAAVRTRVLSVSQIRDRLTDRFGLLTGGGWAALPRHQTLRTTIDWSHDLLMADEQALLRRLCVFAGRFTVDDVESVCGGDDVPPSRVLDVLSSLVDKSLVTKDEVKDVACYRLHETMREYTGLKLREVGEEAVIELRCAEYYRDRCQQTLPQARYRLVEWLDWMDLEMDNIRSVLQRCLARQDRQRGLELASAVGWYWVTRATSEGVRWLDELVGPGADPPGHLGSLAFAQFMRGFLAVLQADLTTARPALERAAAAADEAGLPTLRAQSLSLASIAAHGAGDSASARDLLAAADAITSGLDNYPATIALLQARALVGLLDGDVDAVRSASTEGVRLSREVGDLYALEMMLLNLGLAALIGGDIQESKPLLVEALRIARRIDDRVAQYILLDGLGCYAADSGQPRLAAQLFGAAETVQHDVGATLLPTVGPLLTRANESARTALGSTTFQAQVNAGRDMGRDDAIGLALGERTGAAAPKPGGTGTTPLGKREAEVARLVAEGLSNRQIGARLFISEHTVDSHVRSILSKLGFSSRAQVAAWMASSSTQ